MTREEFDRLYFGKAIHCDTKEKAKEFLALADSIGHKWFSGSSLIGRSFWETHEKETYYHVTNYGLVFGNTNYIKQNGYQIIEYETQPKFKAGDKVRVKDTIYTINGKVGIIIERESSLNTMFNLVKINGELWRLTKNQLEKVEESTYKEETINSTIEEIKENQKRITALLNRLEQEVKNK